MMTTKDSPETKPNSTETVSEFPAAAFIAELCDALQPFAAAYENEGDGDKHEDQHNLWEHPAAVDITVGDLRRALHALAKAASQ